MTLLRWFLASGLVGAVVLAGWFVHHKRPLLESEAVSLTAVSREYGPTGTQCYRMLGRPGLYFLKLEDNLDGHFRWLAVDTNRKLLARPHAPQSSPYLHFNHDRSLGVALTDRKAGEWVIHWNGPTCRFSNETFEFVLEIDQDR